MKIAPEGSDPLVVAIENAQRAVESFGRYLDAAQALEDYIKGLLVGESSCLGCIGQINSGLNVRDTPSTTGQKLTEHALSSGDLVCVTEVIKIEDGEWFHINKRKPSGDNTWVYIDPPAWTWANGVTLAPGCTPPEVEWLTADADSTSLWLINDQQFGDDVVQDLIDELINAGLTPQDLVRARTVTELRRAWETIQQCTGCTAVVISNGGIRSIPDDSGAEIGALEGTLVVCITATAKEQTWFRVANGWIQMGSVRLLNAECDLSSLPEVRVEDLGGGLELLFVDDVSNDELDEFATTEQQRADLRSQLEALGPEFLAEGEWTVEQLLQAVEIVNELAGYGVEFGSPAVPWTFENLQVVYGAVIVAVERTDKLHQSLYGEDPGYSKGQMFRALFAPLTITRVREIAGHPGWYAQMGYSPWGDPGKYAAVAELQLSDNAFSTTGVLVEGDVNLTDLPAPQFNPVQLALHEISHTINERWSWSPNVASLPGVGPNVQPGLNVLAQLYVQQSALYARELAELGCAGNDAGYTVAARSTLDDYELVTDAIVNWMLDSYTDDPCGELRRRQMDDFMSLVARIATGNIPLP